MRRGVLAAALSALALAALAGGSAPFGRVALALQLDGLAARLFADPEWRAVALSRAGRHDEAAAALAGGSPDAAYNRGTALALAGRYAEALEAFDAALARNPGDAQAAANFDLVASIYAGTELSPQAPLFRQSRRDGPTAAAPIGEGSGRAASTGGGTTNPGAEMGLPEVASRGPLTVRKVFDARYIRASPEWLETLPDVPGAYLAARIEAEHRRRRAAGLSPTPPEDPR